MKSARRFAVGCWLSLTLALAQPPEIGTTESEVVFSTGVNLVPVKVVVRDKEGRAIGNLEKADFILQDRGKDQTIVRFSVDKTEPQTTQVSATRLDSTGDPVFEERSAPPIAIPDRFIAYIFDDMNTDIGDLMRAREAAVAQLAEAMDPATRVAVYTVSGTPQLDFTADRDEVARVMQTIRRWSADSGNPGCPPLTYYWAHLIVDNRDPEAIQAGVAELAACGSEGSDAPRMLRSMAIARLAQGQRESRMGLAIVQDVSRRMAVLPGDRRIVYVSSGFTFDPTLRFDQQHVFEEAIKAKVTVNALDARGVYAQIPGGNADTMGYSQPLIAIFRARMEREVAFQQANVLAEFANATGGKFVWNTNAYDEGFRKLTGSPEYTYSLAFSPSDLKYDGKYHELKVKLKPRPGLDVKNLEVAARSGYFAPNAAADSEERAKEEIRDAVFTRDEVVDLPVELSLQYYKSAPLEAHLTVIAKVNLEGVRFRKMEDRNANVLTVVSVAFDRNGNFVKGVQRVLNMRLRDETRGKLIDQGGISVRSNLDLPPGEYLVRLVVRDSEGNTMATRNGAVEIPY